MKITMLLSGQGEIPGAATVAMWRTDPDARAVWERAADVLGPIDQWLDEGVPSDTRKAQIISAVGSLATYAVVSRELGLVPTFVAGHSVGELAALGIALGLDVADVARLADVRGTAMVEAVAAGAPMGMRAVVNPPADLAELVDGVADVYIANLNSSRQVVISGTSEALETFVATTGIATVPLKVTGAFHTPLMSSAAIAVRERAADLVAVTETGPTVIANRTAAPYATTNLVEEIAEQIVAPVRWADGIRYAYEHGSQVFLDLSSTGMLARMADLPGARFLTVGTPDGIAAARAELRHVIAVEREYDLAARALGVIVTTKNRQQDEALYRESVIPAYQELRAMAGRGPQDSQRILAIVEQVLTVKAVDLETRRRKLAELHWRSARQAA